MESFISNLANGWTAIDLVLIFGFAYLWCRSSAIAKHKESLLYYADIAKKQQQERINELEAESKKIRQLYNEKSVMLSRCIDRPRVNGKYVKKDTKHPTSYTAKENIEFSNEVLFTAGKSYQKSTSRPTLMVADNGKEYLVDISGFTGK